MNPENPNIRSNPDPSHIQEVFLEFVGLDPDQLQARLAEEPDRKKAADLLNLRGHIAFLDEERRSKTGREREDLEQELLKAQSEIAKLLFPPDEE